MKKGITMTPKGVAYFFLALFLFGATPVGVLAQNAAGADADSGEVEDILKETQKQVGGNHRIGIVWWIPAEFWEASAKRQGNTPERAREMFASLREYTIVCVAVGKIGIGTINWSTEADVRANTVLRDAAGLNYKSVTEISSDAQGLLSIVKPVLTNVLGPMGQNLQFLLYPAKTSAGLTIADAQRPGSFSVVISDLLGQKETVFGWRLPLTSLTPPRFCPIGHERVQADWKYCPWHGNKLDEVPLPSSPASEPKKKEEKPS
jgi:hypothetical protein